jgi:hypothetical protein
MKRNEDRIHFDNGHSQGVKDTKQESFWPKMIGYWSIISLGYFYPSLGFVILIWFSFFEFIKYRDRSKLKQSEVPSMWE